MSTAETMRVSVKSADAQMLAPAAPQVSLDFAAEIASNSGRRQDVPVRTLFVRDFTAAGDAPLARLVATGGRGGGVAIKLYLALLWRCSAPPFDTAISARKWAALLGLDDPTHRGARRITDALRTLQSQGLIALTTNRGEASIIQLREESGRAEYTLPSDAYVRETDAAKKQERTYFKVPTALWTKGHIQSLSTPALAMLLICLSSNGANGKQVWWSTRVFPEQYGLSPATRARGTTELVKRRLLLVDKQLVPETPGRTRDFTREKVRNLYTLVGAARLSDLEPRKAIKSKPKKAVKRGPRRHAAPNKSAATTG